MSKYGINMAELYSNLPSTCIEKSFLIVFLLGKTLLILMMLSGMIKNVNFISMILEVTPTSVRKRTRSS